MCTTRKQNKDWRTDQWEQLRKGLSRYKSTARLACLQAPGGDRYGTPDTISSMLTGSSLKVQNKKPKLEKQMILTSRIENRRDPADKKEY